MDNCFDLCAQYILGLPKSPDLTVDDAEQTDRLKGLCEALGFGVIEVEWSRDRHKPANWSQNAYGILRCEVVGDANHAVVIRGHRIVYDPMEPDASCGWYDHPIYVPLSVIFITAGLRERVEALEGKVGKSETCEGCKHLSWMQISGSGRQGLWKCGRDPWEWVGWGPQTEYPARPSWCPGFEPKES